MSKISAVRTYLRDYIPTSFLAWRHGYTKKHLFGDLSSGISIGIIALPLAMAFAISSGVSPEKGLFTAIVAGFITSLIGGSRLQIAGPTGAFVVVIYGVVQRHGYEGLAVATLLAGLLLIIMGLLRFGVVLKYIPYPVIIGFTTGIAVVLFSAQVKDFLGLSIESMPPNFITKWTLYFKNVSTYKFISIGSATATLLIIIGCRRFFPRAPAALIAIGSVTLAAIFFDLPLETIEGRYGAIARTLPLPHFPTIELDKIVGLLPDVFVIAMLAGIESLLSAVIADGMAGTRHHSNSELVGQGIANIASIFFGGIPSTGAIARTTANVQLGAKSPLSGIIHALTVFFLMFFFAPLAGQIPLAALAAVLVMVAWNMSELPHFKQIIQGPKDEALICLLTFTLTLLFDLTVAVQVGVVLAAFLFIKRMGDATRIEAHRGSVSLKEKEDDILIYEVKGPLFFVVASQLHDLNVQIEKKPPRIFILYLSAMPVIDATAIRALKALAFHLKQREIQFLLAGVHDELARYLKRHSLLETIDENRLFSTLEAAIAHGGKLNLAPKKPEGMGEFIHVSF